MSNLAVPASSNAQSAISKDTVELRYGTRFLQAVFSLNCVGGARLTNSNRSAVLFTRNPITGQSIVIERNLEELLRRGDRDDFDPYLMPGDALACYDSSVINITRSCHQARHHRSAGRYHLTAFGRSGRQIRKRSKRPLRCFARRLAERSDLLARAMFCRGLDIQQRRAQGKGAEHGSGTGHLVGAGRQFFEVEALIGLPAEPRLRFSKFGLEPLKLAVEQIGRQRASVSSANVSWSISPVSSSAALVSDERSSGADICSSSAPMTSRTFALLSGLTMQSTMPDSASLRRSSGSAWAVKPMIGVSRESPSSPRGSPASLRSRRAAAC